MTRWRHESGVQLAVQGLRQDECRDAIEEDNTSSNTPNEVGIKAKLRHMQDRGNDVDMSVKYRLDKG